MVLDGVTNVELNGPATGVENVRLNKMDVKKCEFVCADVKQYLFNAQEERKKFDVQRCF